MMLPLLDESITLFFKLSFYSESKDAALDCLPYSLATFALTDIYPWDYWFALLLLTDYVLLLILLPILDLLDLDLESDEELDFNSSSMSLILTPIL